MFHHRMKVSTHKNFALICSDRTLYTEISRAKPWQHCRAWAPVLFSSLHYMHCPLVKNMVKDESSDLITFPHTPVRMFVHPELSNVMSYLCAAVLPFIPLTERQTDIHSHLRRVAHLFFGPVFWCHCRHHFSHWPRCQSHFCIIKQEVKASLAILIQKQNPLGLICIFIHAKEYDGTIIA